MVLFAGDRAVHSIVLFPTVHPIGWTLHCTRGPNGYQNFLFGLNGYEWSFSNFTVYHLRRRPQARYPQHNVGATWCVYWVAPLVVRRFVVISLWHANNTYNGCQARFVFRGTVQVNNTVTGIEVSEFEEHGFCTGLVATATSRHLFITFSRL